MKKKLYYLSTYFVDLITTPIDNWHQTGIIILIALSFFFYPGFQVSDWDLNVGGLWEDGLNIYKNNPNHVYPPWGLILLSPYYLMTAAGSRIASALVIGWLCVQRGWSILLFSAIVFNPYFVYTMTKSNMDILILVFPILLWENAGRKSWLVRGLALSLLLLKPQGAMLLFPYFLWQEREYWRELILPLSAVGLITLPLSLLGRPPLFLQWLANITNPSVQNQNWWALNNLSLVAKTSFFLALVLIIVAGLLIYLFTKYGYISWTRNHLFASLLFASMFLSPYSSNQMIAAGFAFVPSWGLNAVILAGIAFMNFSGTFLGNTVLLAFPVSLAALYLHNSSRPKSTAS